MPASPWLVGFLAFAVSWGAISRMEGPVRCRDGWHSSSIGTQGACSHHGGVRPSSAPWLALLVGAVSGGITAWLRPCARPPANSARRAADAVEDRAALAPPDPSRNLAPGLSKAWAMQFTRHCPVCGGGMRAVSRTAGPEPYGDFWECLDPDCMRLEVRADEGAPRPPSHRARPARSPKRRR